MKKKLISFIYMNVGLLLLSAGSVSGIGTILGKIVPVKEFAQVSFLS